MRTIIKSTFSLFTVLGFSIFQSCTNENIEQIENDELTVIHSITATTEIQSRVDYTDNGIGNGLIMKWEEGDEIYVGVPSSNTTDVKITEDGSGFQIYSVKNISTDGKTATFEPKEQATEIKAGSKIMAFYGGGHSGRMMSGNEKITLSQLTGLKIESKVKDCAYLSSSATVSENVNFVFVHESSYLRLNISNIPNEMSTLSSIKLNFNKNLEENTFHKTVSFDSNGNKTYSKEKVVSITKETNNIDVSTNKSYSTVIALLPQNFNTGSQLQVYIYDSNNVEYVCRINIGGPIIAGKCYDVNLNKWNATNKK